jgi:iron complex outermembrane receptor protein
VKINQYTKLMAGVAPVVLGVAMLTTPAFAQDSGASEGEAIVVTGSRIARPDLDSVVPVAVLDNASIARNAAVNIQDVLQEMPQVGVGTSRTNSNFSTGGNGVATINLRNLGSSRTLVLVNGRRFVAGLGGTSAVDINNIPTELVERVDVTTGGASSIYGSDAISGVVNFIMKDSYEGINVRGQYNITEKGDNPRYYTSITAGTKFADGRGSIMGNFSYDKDTGLRSNKRAMSKQDCYFDICGPDAYSSFAPQGRFELLNGSGAAVNGYNGGSLFSFDENNNVIAGNGAGFNRNNERYISVPVERYLATAIANYEVADGIKVFGELTYAKTKSNSSLEASALQTDDIYESNLAGIPITNAFIPQSVMDQINAYNTANPTNAITSLGFRRRQNEVYSRSNNASRDTWRAAVGVKGDINEKWQFEASYVYGTMKDRTSSQDIDSIRYLNALDSVRLGDGTVVCRSEAARAEGCAPINIFGYNTAGADASAYVQSAEPKSALTKMTQHVASAVVSGSPFALPAGDVGVAIGAEYRSERSSEDYDTLTNIGGNSGNMIPDTFGKFDVWEVFGEVNVPLLRDKPFFENLAVGGAVRYSDYSQTNVGGVFSWSVNGDWSPVRGLTFRSTYSIANRAPNISEFASAPSETYATVTDPCNGVTASTSNATAAACRSIPAIANAIQNNGSFAYTLADLQGINGFIGGNPELKEEKAKTLTVGAVIQPAALRNFSLTVDYFNIKVDDAIGTIDRDDSISQCLLSGNTAFCDNVTRNANTGFVTRVDAQLINVATLKTSGIDVGVRYGTPLNLWGDDRIELTGNYTYLINYKRQDDPSAPVKDYAGTVGLSEHRASARATYLKGPLSFSWQVNYLSKAIGDLDFVGDTGVYGDSLTLDEMNRVGDRWYHDVQARVDIGDNKEFGLYAGVDNLFNSKAPYLPGTPFSVGITGTETAADVYDTFGRRFYVGASVKF